MSKESFSWKSLFINESGESSNVNTQSVSNTMPASESKFPTSPKTEHMPDSVGTVNNPYLAEILEVYEKGLNSLNLPDFDFFELYKSVIAVGVNNPQSYQMAFTMGKTIKSDLSKPYLLEKAQYYISEIEKVYSKYDSTGKTKQKDLDNSIVKDKINLTKSISDIEAQISALQKELETKKIELGRVDLNYQSQNAEIEKKIEANNLAKQKIVDSINQVVAGINQYL